MHCIFALESGTQIQLEPDVWTRHSVLNPRRISVNGNWKSNRTTERNSLAFFNHLYRRHRFSSKKCSVPSQLTHGIMSVSMATIVSHHGTAINCLPLCVWPGQRDRSRI